MHLQQKRILWWLFPVVLLVFVSSLKANTSIVLTYEDEDFHSHDGTVTIIKPQVKSTDKTYNIASTKLSDMTGVCKAYGYSGYLSKSMKPTRCYNSTTLVKITAAAQFGGFDNRYESSYISKITCYSGAVEPQPYYSLKKRKGGNRVDNPDTSITLYSPAAFRGADSHWISAQQSNLDTVCQLFGYPHYLTNTVTTNTLYNNTRTVKVDSKKKLVGFHEPYEQQNITSLTCYFGSAPPPLAPDLEGLKEQSNPDGSHTLTSLSVFRGHSKFSIQVNESDANGICNLFNYARAIPNSISPRNTYNATVIVVGRQGSYVKLVRPYEARTVNSISCIGFYDREGAR